MSENKHAGHDLFLFLAGRAVGMSSSSEQRPITSASNNQAQASPEDYALPASRVDHAEAVLGYLKKYENDLLERRRTTNELRLRKAKDPAQQILELTQVPAWTQPEVPSIDEIVHKLNQESIWTVNSLREFSDSLSSKIFADARRCFGLLAKESIPYLARTVEKSLSRRKQEILLAISIINSRAKQKNSQVSFIYLLRKDKYERIIPTPNIQIPTQFEIEERLIRTGVETWDECYAIERELDREIFSETESDTDFEEIASECKAVRSIDSELQLKLYKSHRVQPPEWLLSDAKPKWKLW
jgi:hypothetical protein